METEHLINHVIANGAAIEARLSGLGTVWPTRAELDRADRHADKLQARAVAAAEIELANADRRTVGGEVRFYITATIYTPVKRNGSRVWFETRADGDYSITAARAAQSL